MIYLRSFLAGVLTVVGGSAAILVLGILALVFYSFTHREPAGGAPVGWDPISLIEHPPLPLILFLVVCFSAGCIWEYRKLTSTHR